MRKLIYIGMAALFAVPAFAQEEQGVDSKEARKMEKEQRKLQEQMEAQATKRLVDSLVSQRDFVLTADYLSNQSGRRVVVDNNINFIAVVDSSDIVIQYGSLGSPMIGYNGLGGLTTDGKITKFEVTKTGKNKDNYSIKLTAMTTLGIYDIFLYISPDGNSTATIGGNTRGKLIYYGNIVPIKGSRIYQGSTI